MASPTSSPISPARLSPRSKVNALLAAFDDSSEDDKDAKGNARARLAATIGKKNASTSAEEVLSCAKKADEDKSALRRPEPGLEEEGNDGDDGDEAVQIPRRGKGRHIVSEVGHGREEPSEGTAAGGVDKMDKLPHASPMSIPSLAGDEADSEDNLPAKSRKGQIKPALDRTPASSPRKEINSPTLFVSPKERTSPSGEGVPDSEGLPANPTVNNRVLALVAKIRQERKAKEAKAKQKHAEMRARSKKDSSMPIGDVSDVSDDDAGRRLTQQVHPTRRASKKALEEMARETQRLARNHQAIYKPTTKKKFTKTIFFDKFNFRPGGESETPATSSSPAHHSDVEMRETPPTSPADELSESKSVATHDPSNTEQVLRDQSEKEVPSLEKIMVRRSSSHLPSKLDKGKGKADGDITAVQPRRPVFVQRPIRIRPAEANLNFNESDDDLEIVSSKPSIQKAKLDQYLQQIPEKKDPGSNSLKALRILAHVTSPGKQQTSKKVKPSMNVGTLQRSLQQRARQQAVAERQERKQKLRDSGVIIQSAEERDKAMAEVEDIIARARREGEEISKREKAAAKKEREAKGELDLLEGSSDDEDWEEDERQSVEDYSGSGSGDSSEGSDDDASDADSNEEEDIEDEQPEEGKLAVDDEQCEDVPMNSMIEDEATESQNDEKDSRPATDEPGDDAIMTEGSDEEFHVKQPSRIRRSNVISDEEDKAIDFKRTPERLPFHSPLQPRTDSPAAPTSVLRSASKCFIPGIAVDGPAGLGLTQIFAGTIDDSPVDEPSPSGLARQNGSEQDSMSFLNMLPPPTLPPFAPTLEEDTQDLVKDSQPTGLETQTGDDETPIYLNQMGSQSHDFDSPRGESFTSQYSDFGTPTQDVGFSKMTPILSRFADQPPSTIDTILLDRTTVPPETPTVKPRRKVRKKAEVSALLDEEAGKVDDSDGEQVVSNSRDAFEFMRKEADRKDVDKSFDKKRSLAKDMVNEQAEESDDEYAGLGGASDDDSGEEEAFANEMIDDAAGNDVDEGKLAAFFADRERASDEKAVEKLYNDISKGMLRRKRGANYELSDSDDDGEARRRMKQKEFAKMRKALLADERVGKIAENPKRQAFLRSIEDRNSDDDTEILDGPTRHGDTQDSQDPRPSQTGDSQQLIPNSQPESMGPPIKRKRTEDASSPADARPPPYLRRTKIDRKPSSLSEIRESLSFLIEDPDSLRSNADAGADSEEDELDITYSPTTATQHERASSQDCNKENRNPFQLRRASIPVIDRISLKRNASASASSVNTRLAFAAASSSAAPGFKVPALLRRATTNSSLASSTSGSKAGFSGTERLAGGAEAGGGAIKKGAGKNSGVNYFARENERRAAVAEGERKRDQRIVKGAKGRRKVIGGLLGKGKFE